MTLLNFGQYLQCKREALKLSRESTAKQMQVSTQSINYWESNKVRPTGKRLEKIKKFYNISDDELKTFHLKAHTTAINNQISVAILTKNVELLMEELILKMDGISNFEQNIKNKALNQLECVRTILDEIKIVDEALSEYRENE